MEALGKFKWSLLFNRRSDSGASHIEMLGMEQRKLSRNSNGHNFSHGGQIQAHNISRRSKLNKKKLSRNSNGHYFSLGDPIQAHHI